MSVATQIITVKHASQAFYSLKALITIRNQSRKFPRIVYWQRNIVAFNCGTSIL